MDFIQDPENRTSSSLSQSSFGRKQLLRASRKQKRVPEIGQRKISARQKSRLGKQLKDVGIRALFQ